MVRTGRPDKSLSLEVKETNTTLKKSKIKLKKIHNYDARQDSAR